MRHFEPKKARIEIIPMIDIMLFLLVFFIMITLHMIPTTGITSNLATSTTATEMNHPKVLVTVDAQGVITVDSQVLTPAELTAKLHTPDAAHTVVTIAGAKDASLQHLMAVMDACRTAGVTQIGLAARNAP
ncbi:MAG: biopolymer transporter ExbD [Halothiobacillus sp. 24-54-40]|jgi:biopolymer transport protein ExbD|nr:biopolymer transporter ExbD [Halothiobacillaceae bacterium]OYV46808.1 MAG: biopolymer transporter ExbD [Halothiobacillus sp. 20-53-49]OYY32460.1 MAG: biopolymer transporter ExbD [Halothiobacillus sp. 35-54-62]OYZ86240.1 MAG: biopolymer transporter ExbD [Halothiobacillus sp. 24-54-40]OZA80016.1 MAG: biopolymer transporter ExbD [Halothiobacillus sp. 39-53-45]HQS03662.1 biopolymer transporter ExbD [Halothiobacillus sp.]